MSYMFNVRFRACAFLKHAPELGRTHAACAPEPSLCATSPRHTHFPLCRMPPCWTRQNADDFNQPLSFDTSSVIDTSHMFHVRFRLRLLPTPELWATCTPRALC